MTQWKLGLAIALLSVLFMMLVTYGTCSDTKPIESDGVVLEGAATAEPQVGEIPVEQLQTSTYGAKVPVDIGEEHEVATEVAKSGRIFQVDLILNDSIPNRSWVIKGPRKAHLSCDDRKVKVRSNLYDREVLPGQTLIRNAFSLELPRGGGLTLETIDLQLGVPFVAGSSNGYEDVSNFIYCLSGPVTLSSSGEGRAVLVATAKHSGTAAEVAVDFISDDAMPGVDITFSPAASWWFNTDATFHVPLHGVRTIVVATNNPDLCLSPVARVLGIDGRTGSFAPQLSIRDSSQHGRPLASMGGNIQFLALSGILPRVTVVDERGASLENAEGILLAFVNERPVELARGGIHNGTIDWKGGVTRHAPQLTKDRYCVLISCPKFIDVQAEFSASDSILKRVRMKPAHVRLSIDLVGDGLPLPFKLIGRSSAEFSGKKYFAKSTFPVVLEEGGNLVPDGFCRDWLDSIRVRFDRGRITDYLVERLGSRGGAAHALKTISVDLQLGIVRWKILSKHNDLVPLELKLNVFVSNASGDGQRVPLMQVLEAHGLVADYLSSFSSK